MIPGIVAGASLAAAATAYLHYRVNISATNGNANFTGITELEGATTAAGTDEFTGGTSLSGGSGSDTDNKDKAFNNNLGDQWTRFGGINNCYLGYTLALALALVEIRITGGCFNTNQSPRDFTLEGSNDGMNWTVLKTVAGETTWTLAQVRTYSIP